MIASEAVRRAMKLIGVLAAEETPSAAEVDDGVDSLNQMLHAWSLSGVDLSWSDVVSTDDLNVPDQYLEGVVYSLAVRLADQYVRQVPQVVLMIATNRMDRMIADNHEIPTVTHDQTMLDSDAHRSHGFNVLND